MPRPLLPKLRGGPFGFRTPQPGAPVFPVGVVNWSLSFSDTTTSTDQLANDVGKVLSDTTTSTDQLAKRPGKFLADTTTSTDALANRPGKNLSDTTTATDALANRVGKNLADSSTTTDLFARVVAFHSSFADTTTSTDSATLQDNSPPVRHWSPFVDRGMYERDNGRWNYHRRRWDA